jgi:hypothetical protein
MANASKLQAVAIRLLEVVADDLVQLDELPAVLLQPHGESFVQLAAGRLRQRVVGGIPDQQVAETAGVLARELRLVRANELLAHQPGQPELDVSLVRCERLHRAPVEDPALDRASLEHPALGRLELVEPRREQGLDRSRHGDFAVTGLLDQRHHLLDEEGVPFGRVADPLVEIGRKWGLSE